MGQIFLHFVTRSGPEGGDPEPRAGSVPALSLWPPLFAAALGEDSCCVHPAGCGSVSRDPSHCQDRQL